VLTRGDHASRDAVTGRDRAGDPLRFSFEPRAFVPAEAPGWLLSRAALRAFNALWFRRARERRGELQPLSRFFHPLDGVAAWNRLYGPRGLVQHQSVVPFGREDVLRELIEAFSTAGAGSLLAVLKRFGPGTGMLSFPMEGWTLALDVPAGRPGLARLLDRLDERVAAAGGRVYLAKDSRLRADLLAAMYPELPAWRDVRAELDPHGVLRSDLARRLGLVAA
jgi:decaprenylphospho-beta-D-ribofuranose 2-oxidase